jgi:hypothetical protein
MSFSRVRLPGLWIDGTTVPGTEWEQFDENLSNALDGADGGTYSLSDHLIIGGVPGVVFGVEVDSIFNGEALFQREVTFDDLVTVDGEFVTTNTSTFGGDVDINAALAVSGTVGLLGDVLIGDAAGDALLVAATTTAFSPWNFQDDVTFDGVIIAEAAQFNDVVEFNFDSEFNGDAFFNAVTFREPVGFTGTGKIKWRNKTISVAGDQSVVAANYDQVYVPSGVLVADATITISDTNAEDGMQIRFTTADGTYAVGVETPTGSVLGLKNISGFYRSAVYQRIDGVWRRVDRGDD